MTNPDFHPLMAHPATPTPSGVRVAVHVERAAAGALALRYLVDGAIDTLCIPAPCAPKPLDGLWRHTCFEVFVASAGACAYREFNFSPSGCWAAYAFKDTRVRRAAALPAWRAHSIVEHTPERLFSLSVTVPAPQLPDGSWQIGLSAVLEACDGSLSYWALRHPAAQPDFHHRDSFALMLPEETNP